MKFFTETGLPPSVLKLTPKSKVIFMGSCFATHMGNRMASCLPEKSVIANPMGVMYNPASICQLLLHLLPPHYIFPQLPLFMGDDGLWRHWYCSSLFAEKKRSSLTSQLRGIYQTTERLLKECDALLVTFSTDTVFRLKEGRLAGKVVANCHKQPASMFSEETCPINEMMTMWNRVLKKLTIENPTIRVIFTLSPYRYTRHGLHANALSKARLLILIDALCKKWECASYFPAYEIITDELRDYRFYNADMLHPSEQATDYVWEKFQTWAFTPDLREYALDKQRILRCLAHRPLHPQSLSTQRFAASIKEMEKAFYKKWGDTITKTSDSESMK